MELQPMTSLAKGGAEGEDGDLIQDGGVVEEECHTSLQLTGHKGHREKDHGGSQVRHEHLLVPLSS